MASNTCKITNLKTAIQEMETKTEMNTERMKFLLTTNRERFNRQLKEALDGDWTEWAKQVAESSIPTAPTKRIGSKKIRAFIN